jgi:hypothetical protein
MVHPEAKGWYTVTAKVVRAFFTAQGSRTGLRRSGDLTEAKIAV